MITSLISDLAVRLPCRREHGFLADRLACRRTYRFRAARRLRRRRTHGSRRRLAIALALIASPAFAVTFVPIAGDLSVITSPNRRSAAVTVSNGNFVIAQFCASFPEPLDEPIKIKARGHVIYLPRPIEGLPSGTQINGPEPIAQTLTVVPDNGPAIAFVAKGVKPIQTGSIPILISNVTRQDWVDPDDKRRVLGVEACFNAGG